MDCICVKRKHKRRDERKFRPLSPGVSPVHSQPSTLGHHGNETRLPKVNSTGLWMDAPHLYTGTPSHAYVYGRPPGKVYRDERPLHIPRAASETRLPQPKHPFAQSRPVFNSHNNVYIMPVHPGVQRFYHSQQLAPVYEVPPSSHLEIYDVYQFGGGFSNGAPRSKLLETKHTPYYYRQNPALLHHNQFRLERSHSDAQDRGSRSSSKRDVSNPRRQGSRHNRDSLHSKSGSRETLPQGREYISPQELVKRTRTSQSLESLRENGPAIIANPATSVSSGVHKKGNRSQGSRSSSFAPGDKPPPGSRESYINGKETQPADGGGAHVNKAFTTHESQHTASTLVSKGRAPPEPTVKKAHPSSSLSHTPNVTNGVSGVVSTYASESHSNDTNTSYTTSSISPSATDSMKLLSKNKTDDQKTSEPPGPVSVLVGKHYDDTGEDINFKRYEYGGDIYTVPSKAGIVVTSDGEQDEFERNPIVGRMKQMVLEKTRSNPTNVRNDAIILQENGINEEVTKVTNSRQFKPSDHIGTKEQTSVGLSDGFELPDILDDVSKITPKQLSTTLSGDHQTSESEKSPHALNIKTANRASTDPIPPSPGAIGSETEPLSPRSTSTESADDINKAGKRITASAFEFLEQYLSDDDGTDTAHVESPPLSPTALTVGVH